MDAVWRGKESDTTAEQVGATVEGHFHIWGFGHICQDGRIDLDEAEKEASHAPSAKSSVTK